MQINIGGRAAAGAKLSKLQGLDTAQGTWQLVAQICCDSEGSNSSHTQQWVHTGATAALRTRFNSSCSSKALEDGFSLSLIRKIAITCTYVRV